MAGVLIGAASALLLGLVQIVLDLIRRDLLARRRNKVVIGVIGAVPQELFRFEDVSTHKKINRTRGRVVVLHCKNLSYALKHADFVLDTGNADPKIITIRDLDWVIGGNDERQN